MEIAFTVEGRPPRKGGDLSMWGKPSEVPLLIRLRKEALNAKTQAKLDCFQPWTGLQLKIFVPKSELPKVGDLDTFVAGVLDGLQKAHPNVLHNNLHTDWEQPEHHKIHPRYAILINNDKNVVSIRASKQPLKGKQKPYYTVAIETIEP